MNIKKTGNPVGVSRYVRLPADPLAGADILALVAAMREETCMPIGIGATMLAAVRESLKARKIPRAKRVPVLEPTKETL